MADKFTKEFIARIINLTEDSLVDAALQQMAQQENPKLYMPEYRRATLRALSAEDRLLSAAAYYISVSLDISDQLDLSLPANWPEIMTKQLTVHMFPTCMVVAGKHQIMPHNVAEIFLGAVLDAPAPAAQEDPLAEYERAQAELDYMMMKNKKEKLLN